MHLNFFYSGTGLLPSGDAVLATTPDRATGLASTG